jgi:hypothetical protein
MVNEVCRNDRMNEQYVSSDSGHGRQVDRYSFICPLPEDLPDQGRWKGLKAIGAVVSISQRNGKEHTEVRYYILSRYLSGPDFANAVVAHWGIENNLHWQLDVTFGEDQCRLRKGHSDAMRESAVLNRETFRGLWEGLPGRDFRWTGQAMIDSTKRPAGQTWLDVVRRG